MNKYEHVYKDFKDFLIRIELIVDSNKIGLSRSEIEVFENQLKIKLDESFVYYLLYFGGEFRQNLKTSNTDFLVPSLSTIRNANQEATKQHIFKSEKTTLDVEIDCRIPIELETDLNSILFIYHVEYSNAFEFIELNIENPRLYVIFESLNSTSLDILSNGFRISVLPMHYFFQTVYFYYTLGKKSLLQSKYIEKIPWIKAYEYLEGADKYKYDILTYRCEYYQILEKSNLHPTIDQLEYGFIKYLVEQKNMKLILESFNPYKETRTHKEYIN